MGDMELWTVCGPSEPWIEWGGFTIIVLIAIVIVLALRGLHATHSSIRRLSVEARGVIGDIAAGHDDAARLRAARLRDWADAPGSACPPLSDLHPADLLAQAITIRLGSLTARVRRLSTLGWMLPCIGLFFAAAGLLGETSGLVSSTGSGVDAAVAALWSRCLSLFRLSLAGGIGALLASGVLSARIERARADLVASLASARA